MLQVARLLDQAYDHDLHSKVVKQQMEKLRDPHLTPSSRVMRQLSERSQSFFQFAMHCALEQEKFFRNNPLSPEETAPFLHEAKRSLEAQRRMEASDNISFEQYLEGFFSPNVVC